MNVKPTERMIREATVAEERRVRKAAPEVTAYAVKRVKSIFASKEDVYLWYDAFAGRIASYLYGKYSEWNDMPKDEKQRDACWNALKFICFRRGSGYLETGLEQRFERVLAAIYVLAMFVPGRHLGFTVSGSSLDRYLLTGFGGTLESCGKYGFGVRILDETPAEIAGYVADVLEMREI